MQTTTAPASTRQRNGVCCSDAPCDSGLRNQYFEGKRLTADAFRVEQDYALARRRLLNRAIHGWGVVYGFDLRRDANTKEQLQLGAGLALDACGRELLRTEHAALDVAQTILFDAGGARIDAPPPGSYALRAAAVPAVGGVPSACWLLSAHYAEQLVGPVRIHDPCSCERNEWDQVCETIRFSLRRVDCAAYCLDANCALTCGCTTGPCSDQQTPGEGVQRGGGACLCTHLAGLTDSQTGGLTEIDDECVHVRADLCNGVPLACVSLREGPCDGEWVFDTWFDACGPRRLVKGNELLFDLLRGCDLTHISAIGWDTWHRQATPVAWDDFANSFGVLDDDSIERMRKLRDRKEKFPVVTSSYWVEFSRPVRRETVLADCFAMTVLDPDNEGGWYAPRRVPILDVDTWGRDDTPAGMVTRAILVVDGRWLYDAVQGTKTIFDVEPVTVEIIIRGDLIIDCNGQAVDADARGLAPVPTGNGSPGGTFFSRFQVESRFAEKTAAASLAGSLQGVQP